MRKTKRSIWKERITIASVSLRTGSLSLGGIACGEYISDTFSSSRVYPSIPDPIARLWFPVAGLPRQMCEIAKICLRLPGATLCLPSPEFFRSSVSRSSTYLHQTNHSWCNHVLHRCRVSHKYVYSRRIQWLANISRARVYPDTLTSVLNRCDFEFVSLRSFCPSKFSDCSAWKQTKKFAEFILRS